MKGNKPIAVQLKLEDVPWRECDAERYLFFWKERILSEPSFGEEVRPVGSDNMTLARTDEELVRPSPRFIALVAMIWLTPHCPNGKTS